MQCMLNCCCSTCRGAIGSLAGASHPQIWPTRVTHDCLMMASHLHLDGAVAERTPEPEPCRRRSMARRQPYEGVISSVPVGKGHRLRHLHLSVKPLLVPATRRGSLTAAEAIAWFHIAPHPAAIGAFPAVQLLLSLLLLPPAVSVARPARLWHAHGSSLLVCNSLDLPSLVGRRRTLADLYHTYGGPGTVE